MFRDKLKSKAVINKGCILDGFPKTYDQAKALYEEIDEDGEPSGASDSTTVPEVVIDFTATEDFLKQRMMNLPEEVVQVTQCFITRLEQAAKSSFNSAVKTGVYTLATQKIKKPILFSLDIKNNFKYFLEF